MATHADAIPSPSLAAPRTGWRRMVGDWLAVGGATAVGQALGVVTSLVFRSLLDPAQMGVWQALKMLLGYGNYANLGISKGAAREFTIAMGRGDAPAARRSVDLAFTVNTLSSLAFAAILVGAGLWIGATGDSPWSGTWAVGLAVIGALAVLDRYVSFQVTILRARQAFADTAWLSILEAVLTLVAGGLAIWALGLPGMYLGTLAVLGGSLVFIRRHQPSAPAWAWDLAEIRRLTAIGSPILLTGVASSVLRSLDKLMILGCLDDREFQLGCYSVALLVTGQLYGMGNMLATVVAPRLGERFGRSGQRQSVAWLAARASELQAAALALPAGLAIVAAPPLLARILPDYRSGLAPVAWLVPGVVAMSLALAGGQYLVAVDRQCRGLAAVLATLLVTALANYLALASGYGLVGVAATTAAGYAFYFVLVTAISFWTELDARQRVRYAGMHALALVPAIGSAGLLEYLLPSCGTDCLAVALKVVVVAAAWALSIAIGWHWCGWKKEIYSEESASLEFRL